ncbi:glycosyltransferase family 4 protein [Mesorhizobium sp. 1M-11]|uniref:glycosyltransferase family 4 protein n=1 Tax=Mesorhizobium sp. 1M-11 TaxID=1529006 RepID=UPI001FCDDF54|nr:glycosyltransferase family 4 protein [Mesorhizobium sp. 1M-11]
MLQSPLSNPKLHVLVATPSGGSGQGGIDRIMGALKREFARQEIADIDVRFIASRGPGHVGLSIFYTLGFCLRMSAARFAGSADVVHINVASTGSTYRKMVIAMCARMLGISYVLHLHGAEYRTFWSGDGGFLDRRIRSMFEHASRVVVLGRIWRDFIASRAPGAAGNIVIVPNATETPVLEHVGGGDSVHILFLGRIGERKGVPQLCDALGNMKSVGRWRATIAGDGEVEETRTRLAQLSLADRVQLPGWVGPDEVAALIASADVLVLPSFAENLPVSVIEGMASGLAVVATPVGAVEDILTDEQNGLLVPPGDVAALTKALTRLVEDPALRTRLGEAAKAVHRERLEIAPFAMALQRVWRDAASGTRLEARS